MRISSDPQSPHFFAAVNLCVVLLDGVKQFKCIEADSSEGWCQVWADDGEGGEHKAKLYGEVEILVTARGMDVLKIPNFARTAAWLHACGKTPGEPKDLAVQVGCHLEEFREFVDQISMADTFLPLQADLSEKLLRFSDALKSGEVEINFPAPVKALDALCDMEVTGNGVAYLAGWNKMKADSKVLKANDEKLIDGKPVILEGGKIGKPEGWTAADLSDCV